MLLEEKEQLEAFERVKPIIVEAIKVHDQYSILNMKSGELFFCKTRDEFNVYMCKWGLGTTVEVYPKGDGSFEILFNSHFVDKGELFKDGKFTEIFTDLAISSGRGEIFLAELEKVLRKAINSN